MGQESIKYETFFKLIIATGMRRGECCGLKWSDFDFANRKIHIQRNVVKITGEEIIVKETKTCSGDRYVSFSSEMESLLMEYRKTCQWGTEAYDNRKLTEADCVFRRHGLEHPFCYSTPTIDIHNGLTAHPRLSVFDHGLSLCPTLCLCLNICRIKRKTEVPSYTSL